jgi:uncharacterized lipoprotein YajG
MKITSIFVGAAIVLLAGCGHDHSSGMTSMPPSNPPPSSPPPSTNVSVTTSQLLTNYAQQSSETAAPVAVNGGAFAINDSSETSEPIAVSAN